MKRARSFLFLLFLGIITFHTPCAYAYRFVVYGDCRSAKGESFPFNQKILGAINEKISALHPRPEFAFFLGDCVYPGWTRNYLHNNLIDWKQFMQRGLGNIPFYTAVGNNDLYGNTGWTEFPLQTEFQKTFGDQPSNGPQSYKKLAYAIEHGKGNEKSLFIVLDSFGFYEQNGALVNFDNGVDQEQLDWLAKKAKNTDARYKFVLSHGPAFSVEGWPVHPSIKKVWKIMGQNHFDGFYSAHEHIFSRWEITKKVYPKAKRTMVQTIVGSAGAPLDNTDLVKVNWNEAHIHSGFTYVVVDINDHSMVQKAYMLFPEGEGFVSRLIDTYKIKK